MLLGRLIFGLSSKKDCQRLLRHEPTGSFLIRFSDSVAGSFAVAYCSLDPNQKVKHYLIKPEDIGANKTLPDFLKEKKIFQTLIRLNTATGETTKLDKDVAFAAYTSGKAKEKIKPERDTQGYVQNLEVDV